MTKKHFVAIARVILAESDYVVRSRTALRFADMLRKTNPRFDTDRFLDAAIDGVGISHAA